MSKRKRKCTVADETSSDCSTLKRYTSDGLSVHSDDEEELLPDLTMMTSPSKEKKFQKDDIVWAPHRGSYWPAIVTSVKWPSVCYVFVNESSKAVYNKPASKLLPFDNAKKNQELKEEGEKINKNMKQAYQLIIEYLLKKKTMRISARRFLTTRDDSDKVKEAKDFLMRLGVPQEEGESSEDENHPHFTFGNEENDNLGEDNEWHEKLSTTEDNPNITRDTIEEAQIKEIIKDLETLPSDMKVSSEELIEIETEAKAILCHIKSQNCSKYLMKIRNGSQKSLRHLNFRKIGMVQGGLGPFTLFEDLKTELLITLDELCGSCDPKYKYGVMLPEAIIYGIVKFKKCSRDVAEKYFQSLCSKVGVHDDL